MPSADQMLRLGLYAVGYEEGRTISDPVYVAVTEGRQDEGFASCAELPQWTLELVGYRGPALNRSSQGGWEPGQSIARLAALAEPYPEVPLSPGCIYVMGVYAGLTHAGLVLRLGDGVAWTLDYGQASLDPKVHPNAIGAKIRERSWDGKSLGSLGISPRPVDWVITPERIPTTAPAVTATAYARARGLEPPELADPNPWLTGALVAGGAAGAAAIAYLLAKRR